MPAMTAPPVWKRGFVSMGAVLVVVVMVAGVAHAEVVFRKKAPAATDTTSGEAAPSGGEIGTEAAPSGEAAPAEAARGDLLSERAEHDGTDQGEDAGGRSGPHPGVAREGIGDAVCARTEDARDVYQEAFLKVYRNLHRFRFECSFYTWLYRIVTNVCLDQLRRRQARPEDQAPESNSANHDDGIGDFFERQREHRPTLDPERCLLGKEIQSRIATAMALLSPRERVVFEMKHYQGLKLRAIGDVLGTTEETVKNSLFRATRKLRGQLGELR